MPQINGLNRMITLIECGRYAGKEVVNVRQLRDMVTSHRPIEAHPRMRISLPWPLKRGRAVAYIPPRLVRHVLHDCFYPCSEAVSYTEESVRTSILLLVHVIVSRCSLWINTSKAIFLFR